MTAGRRLAAILAVDVVGYSRLMGEDETGTARAVAIATSTVTIFNDDSGRLCQRPCHAARAIVPPLFQMLGAPAAARCAGRSARRGASRSRQRVHDRRPAVAVAFPTNRWGVD
jgi:adenylate cyclase